jgi:hypothetical protein
MSSLRHSDPARVGLIAGGGRFPLLVARRMREQGLRIVCAGIRHHASPEIAGMCETFRYFGVGRLTRIIRFFQRQGVAEVSWAGWLQKGDLYRPWRWLAALPDWRLLRLYYFRVADRQNQTLLGALAAEFETEGIRVADSTRYCPDLLVEEGVLTRRQPTRAQLLDIAFGWEMAKRMADLDVGQSVAVREKGTLAVEAVEGTDRNIRRAGDLCKGGGFVVVKVAKDRHDMRFDVPTVGPETIESLRAAGGVVLAVEAGKTLIVDREETLARADRHGIVVAAYARAPEAP